MQCEVYYVDINVTQFPVIWAVAGGVWLLRATLLADTPAHRDYDPTGELIDFVVASVCLDLILAGSGRRFSFTFHHVALQNYNAKTGA